MATKPSILTTLSDEKLSAQYTTMSRESLNWLMKRVQSLRNPYTMVRPLTKETHRYVRPSDRQKFLIGGLYYFFYNPKTKAELPYYDTFPLVMPLKREPDGFIGLNFHYLPIKYRINFMRKLMPLAIYNDEDEIKRIRITYPILDSSKRYREFRPCIKKYLYSHIRSKILSIEPQEWDIALYLPIQQFKKENAKTVWQESVEQIRTI
jgi:hypothetical protein